MRTELRPRPAASRIGPEIWRSVSSISASRIRLIVWARAAAYGSNASIAPADANAVPRRRVRLTGTTLSRPRAPAGRSELAGRGAAVTEPGNDMDTRDEMATTSLPHQLKIAARSGIAPFIAMDVLARANALAQAGRDVVHLEVGEPAGGAPAPVVAAAQARARRRRDRLYRSPRPSRARAPRSPRTTGKATISPSIPTGSWSPSVRPARSC